MGTSYTLVGAGVLLLTSLFLARRLSTNFGGDLEERALGVPRVRIEPKEATPISLKRELLAAILILIPESAEKLSPKYMKAVWTAFPDFRVEVHNSGEIGPGLVAHHWMIKGTNTGRGWMAVRLLDVPLVLRELPSFRLRATRLRQIIPTLIEPPLTNSLILKPANNGATASFSKNCPMLQFCGVQASLLVNPQQLLLGSRLLSLRFALPRSLMTSRSMALVPLFGRSQCLVVVTPANLPCSPAIGAPQLIHSLLCPQ